LFNSNSSQNFASILEASAKLNAIAKTNLFEPNPQLAESLLAGTSSTSVDTADTSPASSSQSTGSEKTAATPNLSSQSAESSDIASNLLAAMEQSNLSQTNPDLEQSLLNMLQPNSADAASSVTPGSILNLIA